MSKEEIKRLAKKSLEEKWYLLSVYEDLESWTSDCAFCEANREIQDSLDEDTKTWEYCHTCFINDLPICSKIADWQKLGNKNVIIKALEELAEFGELSEETEEEVSRE